MLHEAETGKGLSPMRLFLILALVCVFTPVSAQPRHDGGDRTHGGGWSGGQRPGSGYGDRSAYERGYRHATRQYYRDRRPGYVYAPGYGYYDPNVVIGTAIGQGIGSMWSRWMQPAPPPQVVYVPQEPIRDVAWCIQRYRSYNPSTRTYLGFDGQFHACP